VYFGVGGQRGNRVEKAKKKKKRKKKCGDKNKEQLRFCER
jgi:hypothetical protein